MSVDIVEINADRAPRSLSWEGDDLVDWVAGGTRFKLDGTMDPAHVNYAYEFDAVAHLAQSPWKVIYKRLGTKGLLLNGGKPVRELNRSFYQAHVFLYPVCLFRDSSGTVLLAHCPDEYNQLEIEDVATGTRHTNVPGRKPSDIFHSRLQASPDGRWLLSAGWVWHPLDVACWFNVEQALAEPTSLDGLASSAEVSGNSGLVEEASACWQTSTRILIGGGEDQEDPKEAAMLDGPRTPAKGVAVYDIEEKRFLASCALGHLTGTMMPVGETHVLTLFEHPRLHRISDGALTHEWPAISCGKERSSIVINASDAAPPIALDQTRRRFAIANDKTIFVVRVPTTA
jgi:hypothetical protein